MPFMEDQQESPTFGGSLADDLFNDPQSALPGPDQLPTSYIATINKIDELAVSGASRRIAWGSNGMIAEITDHGRAVNLRTLIRTGNKTQFDLSDPVDVDLPSTTRFQLPLTHVSWSPINGTSMLALIDSGGNVALYTMSPISCQLNKTAILSFDGQSSMAGCVTFYWLRSKSQGPGSVKVAWKVADSWAYTAGPPEKLQGPTNLVAGMHSFLAITRDNSARFCYPQMNGSWLNIEEALSPCDSIEQMLSHASVAPYKDNSLLVATLSLDSTLRTYEVRIDWGLDADAQGRQLKPGSQLNPGLRVQCLKIVTDFGNEQQVSLAEIRIQPCHLLCMPPAVEGTEGTPSSASVMAVFSTIAQSHVSSMTRTFSSRLVSYTVKEGMETLHSSFTSMAARRGKTLGNTTKTNITLPKEADVDIPGVVVLVTPQRADTVIALLTSDGACRIFDRSSNQLLECDPTVEKMRHPLHAAFAFTPEENADFLDCAFATSGCVVVKRERDGGVTLKHMEAILPEPDLKVVAGLSMVSASTCFLNVSNEDTLSHSWQLLPTYSVNEILLEFFKAINANFDYVSEDSQPRMSSFLINPIMTKSISMLESMYVRTNGRRSIPSKTASVLLELRSQGMAVQLVFSNSADKPEIDVAASLQGLINYYITLMCFLIDDVLDIQRKLRNTSEPTLAQIQDEANKMNSPVLAILLASCPRMMLKVGCRFWRTVIGYGSRYAAQAAPAHQATWLQLFNTINHSSIDLLKFETFVTGLNHYALEAYEAANISEVDRRATERDFLITGVVPEVFEGLAKRLIRHSVDRLVQDAKVDPMKLFRTDVRMLGLTDDASTKEWWETHKQCALRKIELPPGLQKYRKCARCWRVTEDFTNPQKTPGWISKIQRVCVCGSVWVAVEKPKEI